jgi:hypothetical protein
VFLGKTIYTDVASVDQPVNMCEKKNFWTKLNLRKKFYFEKFTKRIILKRFEKTVDGERWTVNGGRWTVTDVDPWTVNGGRWTVTDVDPWTVNGGRWTVTDVDPWTVNGDGR